MSDARNRHDDLLQREPVFPEGERHGHERADFQFHCGQQPGCRSYRKRHFFTEI